MKFSDIHTTLIQNLLQTLLTMEQRRHYTMRE